MKLRYYITILWACINISLYAQCIEKDKITGGGSLGWVTNLSGPSTRTFTNVGDTSEQWDGVSDINISLAPKEVLKQKHKIETKIRDYAGNIFFYKIKFYSVAVVYADTLIAFINKRKMRTKLGYSTLRYRKAKYFFIYEFQPDTIATYQIGIAINKYGKIISKFNFPSKKYYQPIDTTFTYCKLIDIARKSQNNTDPISEISIQYDEKNKHFYWMISQDIINQKEGLNEFNQVMIDAADLKKTRNTIGKTLIRY